MTSHGKLNTETLLMGFGLWPGGQGKLCASWHQQAKRQQDNTGVHPWPSLSGLRSHGDRSDLIAANIKVGADLGVCCCRVVLKIRV